GPGRQMLLLPQRFAQGAYGRTASGLAIRSCEQEIARSYRLSEPRSEDAAHWQIAGRGDRRFPALGRDGFACSTGPRTHSYSVEELDRLEEVARILGIPARAKAGATCRSRYRMAAFAHRPIPPGAPGREKSAPCC